jgi:hypothetical protein
MANKFYSINYRYNADTKQFQQANKEASEALEETGKSAESANDDLGDLGDAFKDFGGSAVGSISKILSASTGIGAIVAIVGLLAEAWKRSQENIDLYLKSADKLKAGSAGFTVDTEEARKETRRRAQGQITLGYKLERENWAKITTYAFLYTDEQKKHFMQLVLEGRELQKNGRALRDSVSGISDKTDWQIKYNELLQEEGRLNDKELKNRERWEGMEAEFVRQRTIAKDQESSIAEKKAATLKAEELAAQILKEKNSFIDEQLINIRAIAEMTQTQELVEQKI